MTKDEIFALLNDIDAKLTRNGIAADVVGYDRERDEIYVALKEGEALIIHRFVDFIMRDYYGMENVSPIVFFRRYPATSQKGVIMRKYYFTYGMSGMPFVGGWTEIVAPDIKTVCALFRAVHPDKTEGVLNCSSIYDEEHFNETIMAAEGNFGVRCHERIAVTRTLCDASEEVAL